MKKLMLSVFAAAALAAGGSAMAQDGGADCNAGSAWGPKPGCNEARVAPPQYDPGWNTYPQQPYVYGNQGYPYGRQAPSARPAYPYAPQGPYAVTPRDRNGDGVPDNRARGWDRDQDRDGRRNRDVDGDGVRNNRDRFPNDPRRN